MVSMVLFLVRQGDSDSKTVHLLFIRISARAARSSSWSSIVRVSESCHVIKEGKGTVLRRQANQIPLGGQGNFTEHSCVTALIVVHPLASRGTP